MSLKPHAAGITAFGSGELNKSFSSHSLNRVTRTTGGGSGYKSEARQSVSESGKYRIVGEVQPSKVVKTIIHYNQKGEHKAISRSGYIARQQAFTTVPFVYQVIYQDRLGNQMIVSNTNIK